jgi:hypothetical protein
MSDSAARVLDFRYGLYSRAYDALLSSCGANQLLRFHALTLRCRRAAELIELAELHVANGFAKVDGEHLGSDLGDCADCVRSGCLAAGEIDQALENEAIVAARLADVAARSRRRAG